MAGCDDEAIAKAMASSKADPGMCLIRDLDNDEGESFSNILPAKKQ